MAMKPNPFAGKKAPPFAAKSRMPFEKGMKDMKSDKGSKEAGKMDRMKDAKMGMGYMKGGKVKGGKSC
jgi:hypothetical protein